MGRDGGGSIGVLDGGGEISRARLSFAEARNVAASVAPGRRRWRGDSGFFVPATTFTQPNDGASAPIAVRWGAGALLSLRARASPEGRDALRPDVERRTHGRCGSGRGLGGSGEAPLAARKQEIAGTRSRNARARMRAFSHRSRLAARRLTPARRIASEHGSSARRRSGDHVEELGSTQAAHEQEAIARVGENLSLRAEDDPSRSGRGSGGVDVDRGVLQLAAALDLHAELEERNRRFEPRPVIVHSGGVLRPGKPLRELVARGARVGEIGIGMKEPVRAAATGSPGRDRRHVGGLGLDSLPGAVLQTERVAELGTAEPARSERVGDSLEDGAMCGGVRVGNFLLVAITAWLAESHPIAATVPRGAAGEPLLRRLRRRPPGFGRSSAPGPSSDPD